MVAAIGALSHSSVFRLTKTWAKVPEKEKHNLAKLVNIQTPTKNFSFMREEIATQKSPLPYLGLIFQDLIFLHTSFPDVAEEGLAWKKMELLGEIFKQVRNYQETPIPTEYNKTLLRFLSVDFDFVPEKELFEMSRKIESVNPP